MTVNIFLYLSIRYIYLSNSQSSFISSYIIKTSFNNITNEGWGNYGRTSQKYDFYYYLPLRRVGEDEGPQYSTRSGWRLKTSLKSLASYKLHHLNIRKSLSSNQYLNRIWNTYIIHSDLGSFREQQIYGQDLWKLV